MSGFMVKVSDDNSGGFREEKKSFELRWSKEGKLQQRVTVHIYGANPAKSTIGIPMPDDILNEWRDIPTEKELDDAHIAKEPT